MCESHDVDDVLERIEDLLATGKQVSAVISALSAQGYEIVSDSTVTNSIFSLGIRFQSEGAQVVRYDPRLTAQDDKTADL